MIGDMLKPNFEKIYLGEPCTKRKFRGSIRVPKSSKNIELSSFWCFGTSDRPKIYQYASVWSLASPWHPQNSIIPKQTMKQNNFSKYKKNWSFRLSSALLARSSSQEGGWWRTPATFASWTYTGLTLASLWAGPPCWLTSPRSQRGSPVNG